ncbi:MAG TPA: 50S ribosomal protein L1 [Candidatus Babeliales bacterium]|jgi:large subunit ribosomal protein L1|nr:50S ribosomal protein L1 [Candidatus Babeliales bacterium]
MAKHGKKYRDSLKKAGDRYQILSVDNALAKVKECAYAKFNESVDLNLNLGINAAKGDQVVRGSVLLPHGTGKKARVIVFAKGDYAFAAEKAGADYVGAEDLIKKIEDGWMDFEYAVATPDIMGAVGKLAKILGPQGKLPNKKVGTVTFDVAQIVSDLKKGRAFFKNDKQGIVHMSIGKMSFDNNSLRENLNAVLKAVLAAKPASSKGKYLKKATIASTMGIGFSINADEFLRVGIV